MAFEKKTLTDLGLTDEQVKGVMVAHGDDLKTYKDKLAAAESERDSFQSQITQRDKDIKSLQDKAKGNETMEAELDALKASYADEKKKHADEIANMQFNNALTSELGKTNARDAEDLMRFINKEEVKFENGKLIGVSEQITALQGSKPYLFEGEIKQPAYNPTGGQSVTPESNLTEAMKSDEFNLTDFVKSQQGE